MAILQCYVDRDTHACLERAARELGRPVSDLAESAIAEAALNYEQSRRRPSCVQRCLPLEPAGRYPDAPGWKEPDTSRKAADSTARRAALLRERCLRALRDAGAAGLTADEAAERLGESILSVRPRFTELLRTGRIADTGKRRRNASGRQAKVWGLA